MYARQSDDLINNSSEDVVLRFVAADADSALQKVIEVLGDNALIHDTKQTAEGIEIQASINLEDAHSINPNGYVYLLDELSRMQNSFNILQEQIKNLKPNKKNTEINTKEINTNEIKTNEINANPILQKIYIPISIYFVFCCFCNFIGMFKRSIEGIYGKITAKI